MLAELLFAMVQADTSNESLNMIHDSTFHILVIWSMEKFHNNIYLVKFGHFFEHFTKNVSNNTLLNAIIKTGLLTDMANYFLYHIYGLSEQAKFKTLFVPFFNDMVRAIASVKNRKDCQFFSNELRKSTNWKYLEEMSQ